MTLDQLKTFYIVANAGSFTNAAAELNMDQSNVSRKIISMETRLRTKLFKRKARGLILTPEGQALLEETKIVLDRIEGMRNLVKNVHTEAKGLLNVNFLNSFYEEFILQHLTIFIKKFPDINLILGKTQSSVSDLEQAGMTVFIRPYMQNTPNVLQEFVTRLHIKLYASEDYIKKHGMPQNPEDLMDHKLIAYEPNSELYSTFNWHLQTGVSFGRVHEPAVRTGCPKTAAHLIREGIGIGPVMEEATPEDNGLVRVLPQLEGRVLDFFYIYPTAHKNAIPVKKFGEFIHSIFKK